MRCDALLGARRGDQPVDRRQERGERLARPGRRADQRVLALGDVRPALDLRRRRLGERGREPFTNGRRERREHRMISDTARLPTGCRTAFHCAARVASGSRDVEPTGPNPPQPSRRRADYGHTRGGRAGRGDRWRDRRRQCGVGTARGARPSRRRAGRGGIAARPSHDGPFGGTADRELRSGAGPTTHRRQSRVLPFATRRSRRRVRCYDRARC